MITPPLCLLPLLHHYCGTGGTGVISCPGAFFQWEKRANREKGLEEEL
jgi:hypothetical protein